MRSHNDSIDTTHTPPPLSFYNTFNQKKSQFIKLYKVRTTTAQRKKFLFSKCVRQTSDIYIGEQR
jgi:hypothetical protein